jgi:small GTP-binding protein
MSEWLSGSVPIVKVVLLGDSSVGKTTLVSVAHGDTFSPDSTPTVGACFIIKVFPIDGVDVKLHIWDTAGQERFRTLTPIYYRDSQYVLLVYAVNSQESFDGLASWCRDLEGECDPLPNLILVGTKTDLAAQRAITKEAGEDYAKRIGARFYEVSAKTETEGVIEIFRDIARHVMKGGRQQPVHSQDAVDLNGQGKQRKCKC